MRYGVESNVADLLFVEQDGLQAAVAKLFLTLEAADAPCTAYVIVDLCRRVARNAWRRSGLQLILFESVVEPCVWSTTRNGDLCVLPPGSVEWELRR